MKKEFSFLSGDGKTPIHCVCWWENSASIKGILQITHGMVEYIERYEAFANYLNEQGILVVGHDHLGHGESVCTPADWGYFAQKKGSDILIRDMHKLRVMTQKKYPGIPYFMLGHSMGSFLLRKYLMKHGQKLQGAVIMGTGTQPDALLLFAKGLCRVMAWAKGWHYRSSLLQGMAFAGNNNKFRGENLVNSWLTKDVEIVKSYSASPKCTFVFTLNGFYHLFDTIYFINRPKHIKQLPKNLPLLLVSGDKDPVGGFGKGVQAVFRTYQKAGIMDITCKLYADDRHEILNETDREKVFAEIFDWMRIRL